VLAGPIFQREASIAPRRARHFVMRSVYGMSLLLLMATAWMIVAKTQMIRNIGDMARFGAVLFQVLAPLQLALMLFLSAVSSASNVAIEKDRQTLLLLLLTRLGNHELVLGKLFASLLNVATMLMASLPIFMLIVLFGGTSFQQVGWTFAVTLSTVLAAGSLGTMIAFWREKTFQALALVALAIVSWVGLSEAVAVIPEVGGIGGRQLAAAMNPFRAIMAASHSAVVATWPTDVLPYLIVSCLLAVGLNAAGIWRVRKWNPSREVRPGQAAENSTDYFSGEGVTSSADEQVETMRSGHVDDRKRLVDQKSRQVWDNPVLWREMRTWAHGKKIVFIRLVYWLMAGAAAYAIGSMIASGTAVARNVESVVYIAPFVQVLVPLMLVSLVMINALAVSSLTGERDLKSIDLLMVTDLTPREFLFGKLLGVAYVAWDLIAFPLLLVGILVWQAVVGWSYAVYLVLGWAALVVFVIMLGVHCGMIYAGSRQAIGVSLGTVFFLFLGIVTAMLMMVSFTGNVEAQFTPFLASIIGGGVGLYVALGSRNRSPAIALASGILPFAMFYSITSILLGQYVNVLVVVLFAYGFTTTAMMVPALSEFNISMGRARTIENE